MAGAGLAPCLGSAKLHIWAILTTSRHFDKASRSWWAGGLPFHEHQFLNCSMTLCSCFLSTSLTSNNKDCTEVEYLYSSSMGASLETLTCESIDLLWRYWSCQWAPYTFPTFTQHCSLELLPSHRPSTNTHEQLLSPPEIKGLVLWLLQRKNSVLDGYWVIHPK